MNQDELRKQLKYLVSYYGSTQQFIGKSIGVSRTTISLFLKGERNLSTPVESKIIIFLKERIK
jgi:DNA-binding XRE family transcriptional regulator